MTKYTIELTIDCGYPGDLLHALIEEKAQNEQEEDWMRKCGPAQALADYIGAEVFSNLQYDHIPAELLDCKVVRVEDDEPAW